MLTNCPQLDHVDVLGHLPVVVDRAQNHSPGQLLPTVLLLLVLNPDFRFERTGPNFLMFSNAFIYAGSDVRITPRRHTPSG